ncbi:MAG: phosphoribosylamine--glycine ligase [Proteobacteria bacterium]|jgi:phosphoribosylamine--glycine ligase|nr:phosphoribosylamine--glycine ligase [Desulfocapsa sp.]MBU3944942.1 phosphoribosylamine--glycine ligase [Pseudomonadota bacterium]MCG2743555.1 phosphoribosylamine--glycine ligase [Desulfobacteraceae bacterium]MBU4027376.1 phosphoribosylamine--glycine ligase [Pseudomonadota bacterium]MBU4044451.1 phosphoribosylamine--glycine ligase [Pseudomonadota bacterium]
MKVLVVGSGGREHALVWKISQSARVKKIYCAPGNAGIKRMAECVDLAATDIDALLQFAHHEKIDLTIVGPESALAAGIVDRFEEEGLRIFGPRKNSAILEGSKVFAKEFMEKYAIPTASFKVFDNLKKAGKYIDQIGAPLVVKADGLAAGKGVIVATTIKEAKDAVELIMQDKAFGEAGNKVVIEACLQGEEASFIAFTDGKTVLPLPTSQDHKAIFDGDKGPNTGGMGAYSPAPVVTEAIADYVMNKVMLPTIQGMASEGRPFRGMLYAGLMIERGNVKVLEFNCRFGDPEAQPLLMRLKSDVVDIFEAVIDGTLDMIEMKIDPRPTVCVVMSSGGYPGTYETGKVIKGLSKATREPEVQVFHAGTATKNERTVTAGGRVLGVTAVGKTLEKAIEQAYKAVDCIQWTGCYCRRDIGAKALRRPEKQRTKALVGIVMGSDSDLPVMQAAADFLKKMQIPYEMTVASAHRTPERAARWASTAQERGLKIIIAGAGMAAHLAGVLAAHTELPVIGVPLDASPLHGMDALLATVQMPPGIPVATMAIGKPGAKNGAVFAARILALEDKGVASRLQEFKLEMVREVEEKARNIEG